MKTAEEIRAEWNTNAAAKTAWARVLESPEWAAACEVVAAEAVKRARSVQRMDGDTILARNLTRLDGVYEAIEQFRSLLQVATPMPAPLEEYDEAYVARVMAEKAQR